MYIMDRVQCRRGKALSRQRGQCISAVYIVGSVGGGGCDDSYQCQNILTHRRRHSPSRKSPPTKVLPLHIIEIPTKPMIPTLWRWCYSAAFSASPSKSPMKPLMTRFCSVLHPGCDRAYQWTSRAVQWLLRKISQKFLTTMPLRLPRMRSKRLLCISTIKSLHRHWKSAVWHCRKRRRKHR